MVMFIDATYKDGSLLLKKKLAGVKNDSLLKVLVFEQANLSAKAKKKAYLSFVADHQFNLPKDYRFDRDEAHER
ncbi:MAG TPA: AbrB family transcriptional regulator [bacterium]|nr:AbrB family transcriptional regulator [bacterium]